MTEPGSKPDDLYLNLIRAFIKQRTGINIEVEKDYSFLARLNRVLQALECSSLKNLFTAIQKDEVAFGKLVHFITTPHTYFFREPQHLKILRSDIILQKIQRPVIWCAASSTGEETYSIVIELLEHHISDFLVIASDINSEVLADLKRGIYNRSRLENVPYDLLKKYFLKGSGRSSNLFKVKDFLKRYIVIKKLNLIDNFRFERPMNYIFARNVLIYFDSETQNRVVSNLLNNLDDMGYLFIGHSESLFHLRDDVESVFSSVYNKKPPVFHTGGHR